MPVRMPKQVPTGTRYVVEGRTAGNGQFRVSARYLVYPDGRRVDIPGETLLPISCCGKAAQDARKARRARQPRSTGIALQLGA